MGIFFLSGLSSLRTKFQFHFQFQLKMASLRSERPIHAPSRLSAVSPRLPSKQRQYLPSWTQIVLSLGGWNVGRFLSPLLFSSGGQCCDALACPCSKSSSSLWAPLPCQAADQMWYLLCLPVYLPVHSHWLKHAQDSRSTEVFVAEDCVWLCASRGSPFQTPPFAGGSLSLWEWWHVRSVPHAERLATVLHVVTASTSGVRLEVMTLWAPLSSCTVLQPCLTMNP